MHDFLEGTLVYNFGYLMKSLIKDGVLTFDEFILTLNEFRYSRLDKKNRLGINQFTKFALESKKGELND